MSLLVLHLLFALLPARAESTGEAKVSSQNAMKKVEDGDPILHQNMMQHMMMAQMYEAQMNFPMAAQERMKAQMLQQQIDTNNNSRDRNKDRRDNAIYTSDQAQSQSVAPIQGGYQGTGSQALGSFFAPVPEQKPSSQEQVSSEFLTFDENTPKNLSPVDENTEIKAEAAPELNTTVTADAVSPQRGAELAADLKGVEDQVLADASPVTSEAPTENVSPVRTVQPPPVLKVEKKKPGKSDDEFWKDPKKAQAKKRVGKRALASLKKSVKASPNRSQNDSAHRSLPPARKPH